MITRQTEESGSRHQLLCRTYRATSSLLLRCNLIPKGPRGTPSCDAASSHTLPREIAGNARPSYPISYPEKTTPIEPSRPCTVCSDQIPTTGHYTHVSLKIQYMKTTPPLKTRDVCPLWMHDCLPALTPAMALRFTQGRN